MSRSAPYLAEVSGALLKFHRGAAINMSLRFESARVRVTSETAVPLGLIVNEFVTNSMKDAFAGGRGTIGLELVSSQHGKPTPTLWDDGKGIPETPSGGTGVRLINGLLQQIGATGRWSGEEGARLVIELPLTAVRG